MPELESELDDLFARPLDEFTGARNELAKRLRKAGQEEAAARVQGLKKPSVPVWAVNQLARRHGDEVQALVEAGAQLRKAQGEAFRGGSRDAVRDATAAERQAARTLTRRAHELLSDEGRPVTRAATDRIGSLLRAASVDPEAAALLAGGRLTEELESSGFGAVAGIAPARPARARGPTKAEEDAERKRREQERKRLEAQVGRRRRALEEAQAKAERAEEAAEKARAAVEEAREALSAAEAELQE